MIGAVHNEVATSERLLRTAKLQLGCIRASLVTAGVAIFGLACGAYAQEGETILGEFYASEENCRSVLDDLSSRPIDEDRKLGLAEQICLESRLADLVVRRRAEAPAPQSSDDAARNLGSSHRLLDESGERQLTAIELRLRDATEQRKLQVEELAQADPQAANELLKRLIGMDDRSGQ